MKRLIVIILSFICYGGSICYAQDIVKELQEEKDGFKWYKLSKENHYGVEDMNGNIIISTSEKYTHIDYKYGFFTCLQISGSGKHAKIIKASCYNTEGKLIIEPGRYDNILYWWNSVPSYFSIYKNGKEGACDIHGNEVVPPKYKLVSYLHYPNSGFYYSKKYEFVPLNITLPEDAQQQYNDGLRYEKQGLYEMALNYYERASENGSIDATYKCGFFYFSGSPYYKNVDAQKALSYFNKAAEKGHVSALSYMGHCYENGKGVFKDLALAKQWYEKAASQGSTLAQERLIAINNEIIRTTNPTNANDQNTLGVKLYNRQNYDEAIKWFKKAAAQGHKNAEYNMGLCYEYGNGTTKNKQEALAWYKKAQKHGNSDAAKRIAELTKPVTVAKTPTQTNTTSKSVAPRNTAPRNDVAYLDVLRKYEGKSNVPDMGPYVRSVRDEHSNGSVTYRFYNKNGSEKRVHIGKCYGPFCNNGRCMGFHLGGFCPNCGNSGWHIACNGTGTKVSVEGITSQGYYSSDGVFHFTNNGGDSNVSVPNSSGGLSGGSSNRSSSSSVYTKCNSCNGTGICRHCHGEKGEWTDIGTYTGTNTKKWSNCVVCNGSGKCNICYGRGKL